MTMIFGIPLQALFGQLLIGLINGSFYALLSLGLAIIFGLLRVINFAHGAQYMLGAFVAYLLLTYAGIGYWPSLILAPVIVGLAGAIIERLFLRRLYDLDPLYGLLFTFGLALAVEGTFRYLYGSSGQPYATPAALAGGANLGFMFLPIYRGWVVVVSLVVCLGTWLLIEKTKLGAYLRAATENAVLVQVFGVNVPVLLTLTYALGAGLAAFARRAGGADLPGLAADGLEHDYRRLRRGRRRRHGIDHGRDHHWLCARHRRGPDQGFLSRGFQHRDLRHHGDRASYQARGPLRTGCVTWLTSPKPSKRKKAEPPFRCRRVFCWRGCCSCCWRRFSSIRSS
ncbi:branched-subunit amino acid ABC-type transport system permease component [Rhizobium leguminosarum]